MRLAIVIVNFRTPHLVLDCLESLQSQVEVGKDCVVVVDNRSQDNSVEKISKGIEDNQWTSWVNLIASTINGGFSSGNNIGIKSVYANAYLLLNSDTIVRPGAIAELISAMNNHPKSGLISPRLEWLDGTPQISCFRYRTPMSELIDGAQSGPITKLLNRFDVPLPVSDKPFQPEWTSFACILIRREVIQSIGLMDEGYFMYFEDIDYCRRAKNAGFSILHWPSARVVHLRGGSGDVKANVAARKRPKTYLYESRSRYFRIFNGVLGLEFANLCWLVGRSISLTRELVGNKSPHTCEYQAVDIWTNWRSPLRRSSQMEKQKS